MIIYCNGDSFTSGVDLADYLIPGYPGGTPMCPWETGPQTPDVREAVNWHKNTYDNSHQLGKSRQTKMGAIRYEEFNRAWPNKLHKLSENVYVILFMGVCYFSDAFANASRNC